MMTGGTLFSGIGAPECAAGFIDWRWAAEIDPFARAVHKARFPGVTNLGDITKVDWHATEPVDLVVGGPPCQDYSVAGQRASLSGARGDLTLQYARTLDAIDPLWSVTENVPGWLSTQDNAFGTFLGILVGNDAALVPGRGQRWTDAGVVAGPKRTAAWRILDAQHFGVPQRRRRVFVVACRGAGNFACAAALFPVGEGVRGDTAQGRAAREDIAAGAVVGTLSCNSGPNGHDAGNFSCNQGVDAGHLIAGSFEQNSMGGRGTLGWSGGDAPLRPVKPQSDHQFIVGTLQGGGTPNGHGTAGVNRQAVNAGHIVPVMTLAIRGRGDSHDLEYRDDGIANAVLTPNGGRAGIGVGAVAFDTTQITSPGNYSVPKPGDPCHPLASRQHPPAVVSAMSVRRLTPVECERLQGFPDGWTDVTYRGKPAADGPRYRAIGNSMATPVIGWVLARVQDIAAAASLEAAA